MPNKKGKVKQVMNYEVKQIMIFKDKHEMIVQFINQIT